MHVIYYILSESQDKKKQNRSQMPAKKTENGFRVETKDIASGLLNTGKIENKNIMEKNQLKLLKIDKECEKMKKKSVWKLNVHKNIEPR